MKIILDAMGGDNAPDANIKGAVNAIHKVKAEVVLVGKEEVIRSKVKEFYGKEIEEISDRLKIKNATETIEMCDIPTMAIKHKKDSSMVVGFKMLKEDEGDVFISAGNSGALLTGATLLVGRIKGIDRPALAGILPAYHSQLLLIDSGSNTNCKPINLLQFAQMAIPYAEKVVGISNPKVALLNIGEEDTKGSKFAQEAHALLRKSVPEFVGNAEGRDLLTGEFDVIVTDGFTGNVCLKTIEGAASVLFKSIKDVMMASPVSKLGALALKGGLSELKSNLSADKYGGAPILGVKGACLVGHGSSNETAIKNGILVAARTVRLDVSGIIAQTVSTAQ